MCLITPLHLPKEKKNTEATEESWSYNIHFLIFFILFQLHFRLHFNNPPTYPLYGNWDELSLALGFFFYWLPKYPCKKAQTMAML